MASGSAGGSGAGGGVGGELTDPVALLQEDLKDDDYECVMQAINRLTTVALAIGPQRVRSELVPFITQLVETQADEALTSIARQLGDFAELVGGGSHIHLLLPLLERFCSEEEVVIRDAAVLSLNKLIPLMSKADVNSRFIPVLKRLADGDWFTTRVSAASLFASIYPNVPDTVHSELRTMFTNLCNDDTPMVRRSAFMHLPKFVQVLSKAHCRSDIFPILKAVAQDDMDSFRYHAVDACAGLSKVVETADYTSFVVPTLEGLQDDVSWRVRNHLASSFADCIAPVLNEALVRRIVPIVVKLLKDKESEVRASTSDKLDTICQVIVGKDAASKEATVAIELITSQVLPAAEALCLDAVQNVRHGLSKSIVGLCPILGKDASANLLLPILNQLSKDESYEVRYMVLARMELLADALGTQGIINSLLPNMLEMCKDAKWRVRLSVIEKCGLLAQLLGCKLFTKRVLPVLIELLGDHVYAIRARTCSQLGTIVALPDYGPRWAIESILPKALPLYDKNANYLHRMTCLLLMECCVPPENRVKQIDSTLFAEVASMIETHFLPLVREACIDIVPNVRISAAKTLYLLMQYLDKKLVQSTLQPLLVQMTSDPDPDVVYFSTVALTKC